MLLDKVFSTQRGLLRAYQIDSMIACIIEGNVLPPIQLAEFEDGSVHVEDGHHRCVAYWLSGRTYLRNREYVLVQKTVQDRPRFGRLVHLHDRCDMLRVA